MRLREQIAKLAERIEWLASDNLSSRQTHTSLLDSAIKELRNAVEQIQPASVDLTQAVADDIVRKMHGPLTISKEFSEWIRGQAEFKDVYWTTPLGYSAMAGQMELRLKTDGSLYLELRDAYGANMWRGSFVPPDYGVTDEPG